MGLPANKVSKKKEPSDLRQVHKNRDIAEIIWENVIYRSADLKGFKTYTS